MTKTECVDLLENCDSETDWSNACDLIKKAHSGGYPDWWYQTVVIDGLINKIRAKWGATGPLIQIQKL